MRRETESETERKREPSIPVGAEPSYSQKPGAFLVPAVAVVSKAFGYSFCVFLGTLIGSWIIRGTAGIKK